MRQVSSVQQVFPVLQQVSPIRPDRTQEVFLARPDRTQAAPPACPDRTQEVPPACPDRTQEVTPDRTQEVPPACPDRTQEVPPACPDRTPGGTPDWTQEVSPACPDRTQEVSPAHLISPTPQVPPSDQYCDIDGATYAEIRKKFPHHSGIMISDVIHQCVEDLEPLLEFGARTSSLPELNAWYDQCDKALQAIMGSIQCAEWMKLDRVEMDCHLGTLPVPTLVCLGFRLVAFEPPLNHGENRLNTRLHFVAHCVYDHLSRYLKSNLGNDVLHNPTH